MPTEITSEINGLTLIGTTTEDRLGEHGVDYYELKFNVTEDGSDWEANLKKKKDAAEFIKKYLPETRCYHSYDCCGNRYYNPSRIAGKDYDCWIITYQWYINI